MTIETPRVPTGSPPRWMNSVMRRMLRTPGLQRLLGKGVALITVTGSRTGTEYALPVSYERTGDTVVVLTKRLRRWWRNLEANPRMRLRLAGEEHTGTAEVAIGDTEFLGDLLRFLRKRPMDARAYGVPRARDGTVDEDRARALLPEIVVIRIGLDRD